MARTKNQSCIHICLDEKTYIVLRQKAAYKNISTNAYLKDLSLNVVMTTYEIGVHDLSDMNSKLDFLTFKASGYYRLVTARDRNQLEVRADDGDRMVDLFKKLSEFMEECYEKLVVNRQSDMTRERELLSQAINSAPKSTYRKSDIWVSVPAIKDVILTVTQEEKKRSIPMQAVHRNHRETYQGISEVRTRQLHPRGGNCIYNYNGTTMFINLPVNITSLTPVKLVKLSSFCRESQIISPLFWLGGSDWENRYQIGLRI